MSTRSIAMVLVFLVSLSPCSPAPAPTRTPAATRPTPTGERPTAAPTAEPTIPATSIAGPPAPLAPSHIAQVWANEGGDKVTRDELRATQSSLGLAADANAVHNAVWDGTAISLFGARNEVVSFNLVLEAPATDAVNVDVHLDALTGPGGARITTRPASAGDDLFDYVGRHIELFYVRYLAIKGLSVDLAYGEYDERHTPARFRRPYDADGYGTGTWADRPDHDRFYPDIAVPLELHAPFTIPAGANQSIWGDITIPKTSPAGVYAGTVAITENGAPTWQIPIRLRVRDFALPDLPTARTMLCYDTEYANERYFDVPYPEPDTDLYARSLQLADRHFQLAHRHKISLIDGDVEPEDMAEAWTARLDGSLFTSARGYDGVGVGVGNNVYSIGTYGSWSWQNGTRADMWANTDRWVNWFDAHPFITPTDYFLYLIDESDDYAQIQRWARWMDDNPGPGRRLMSLATIDIADAAAHTPALDIAAFGSSYGLTDLYQAAADTWIDDPGKRFYVYNGSRPATGSFATEDDGVALRELAWVQYKKGVDRWFYWASTYYNNFHCYGEDDPLAQTNLFHQAQTFGCYSRDDESLGQAGWNYFNGDGVLFYPGTDVQYPQESYGLLGPFASLRLKHWRRGIQDVDYLTLAAAADPARTAQIVNAMVPQALWEYGVSDPQDPTWVRTDISWSIDPDDWEAARAKLADIIEDASR